MKKYLSLALFFFCAIFASAVLASGTRQNSSTMADHITQYGITWTFDKDYPVGQFINGDYWVVGPVRVLSVSPKPKASEDKAFEGENSRYGAAALVEDARMRNGSMIFEGPKYNDKDPTGFNAQGYDSRVINYDENRSVTFPLSLAAKRSLISTISAEKYIDGKLATPYILGEKNVFICKAQIPLALHTAAVLTCLESAPPPDAFRPPYVGTEKPIYREKDILWERLPNLPELESSPDWEMMARFFQRPWLDHTSSWLTMFTLPGQNGPNYGREIARLSSMASLMLLQNVPLEQKKALMIAYLQWGIDLHGLAQSGRQWFADGGHWQGRKWPILFASLMLNDESLRHFPPIDLSKAIYGPTHVVSSPAMKVPTTLFQEDMDYYYGVGGDGQKALWQIVWHTGPQPPHQETPHDELTKQQKFCEAYHFNNAASAAGVALAAQLMGAKSIWNKNAFFDYLDYWMLEATGGAPTWIPKEATRVYDPFVERMWNAYRDAVPEQANGKDNLMWVWKNGATGHWEANPPN